MSMSAAEPDVRQILATQVFVGGRSQPFGALTCDEIRARADELRAATGWGPTARVAPVARAWRELSMEMERAGVARVAELDPGLIAHLAPQMWVVLPT